MLYETKHLCKSFKGSGGEVCALTDITMIVEAGSFVTLSGVSGSGKTTLLGLLGAMERPSSGSVLLEGVDFQRCSDHALARIRRRMGFVFQDYSLIPQLTVAENIIYPLIPRGIAKDERMRRVRDLLLRLNIAGKIETKARDLSGGEQQRVAIARALAGEPDILLADEPTSNLDALTKSCVLEILSELRNAGKTLIVAGHDPDLLRLATVGYELEQGRIRTRAM